MLIVEAIVFGLKNLKVALVLLKFAPSAISFSSASSFKTLKLLADQLEVALFCANNGVEARLSAFKAFGARGI